MSDTSFVQMSHGLPWETYCSRSELVCILVFNIDVLSLSLIFFVSQCFISSAIFSSIFGVRRQCLLLPKVACAIGARFRACLITS